MLTSTVDHICNQYLTALKMALAERNIATAPRDNVHFVPIGGRCYDVIVHNSSLALRTAVVDYALRMAAAFNLTATVTPKGEVVVSSQHGTVFCILNAPKTAKAHQ